MQTKQERYTYIKKWRKKNPDKYLEIKRRYREGHLEKIREQSKKWANENRDWVIAYRKSWKEKNKDRIKGYRNSDYCRFGQYRYGAKYKGYAFEISREEFIYLIHSPCYYCGEEKERIGIDRMNNVLGYIQGNVVSCCKVCNYFKGAMDSVKFMALCKKITERRIIGLGENAGAKAP